MSVKKILNQKPRSVISCKKEDLVLECVKLMNQNKIGALLVLTSSGKIDGIVTERDILRAIYEQNGDVSRIHVNDIMTRKEKLILAGSDEQIEKIMDMMTNNRIRHIPVVQKDDVIGLVSIGDVVKSLLDWAQVENESMKSYISGN